MTNTSLNKIYIPKNNTKFSRGANLVSSLGGGGGIISQLSWNYTIKLQSHEFGDYEIFN